MWGLFTTNEFLDFMVAAECTAPMIYLSLTHYELGGILGWIMALKQIAKEYEHEVQGHIKASCDSQSAIKVVKNGYRENHLEKCTLVLMPIFLLKFE